jgi:asparagine synthase (glutamine-hydrolysing)
MCAINGFNWSNEKLIVAMNRRLSHRGPDGTGIFLDEKISLGHNRLSIIDTRSIANQPMRSNDGRFVVIFNGEIYNFQDLRKKLESLYFFVTNSDTEVILAAYKKWGSSCVTRFNGMFSLAIWDAREKSLFIARDPVGIKPLYYYWDKQKFIFSSEIKAILEHPIPRILDNTAFACYMSVLYCPESYTMFKGIYKLAPGKFMLLKNGELNISSFEAYKPVSDKYDYSDPLILREKINQAVSRQLISDRPLGIYLSGGIDSTTVLDAVSRVRDNIVTFSVGFDLEKNEQQGKFNEDLLLARKTSKIYKTNHHEILVRKDEVVTLLESAVYHLDEPISNPTIIPMIKLAQYARNNTVVVLGGDGGDELFGGYERYRLSLLAEYYQKIPLFLRRILTSFKSLSKLNTKKGIEQFKLFMFQKDRLLKKVLNGNGSRFSAEEFFKEKFFSDVSLSGPELLMRTDLESWLVDESLMRNDKMSMAYGLESRVPLLDLELVEYAKHIPYNKKVTFNTTKKILKDAMRRYIPAFLFNQPKRGWFSPGAKWLRDPKILKSVKEILSPNYYAFTSGMFNWKEIDLILENHVSGKEYNLNILWSIITFQIWAKRYEIRHEI